MSKVLTKLQTDWEIVLFWLMLLSLAGALAIWITGDNKTRDTLTKGAAPPRQSIIGDNALAFLDPASVPAFPESPFSFGYKIDERRPWRRPNNTPTAAPKPLPAPTPAANPNVVKPAPAPTPAEPPKPAAPVPARVLTYRGYMQTASGQTVAFMTVTDPIAKRTTMEQLTVGRKIDGIEIKQFTPDSLEVVAPDGNTQRIPKGGRKKIVLE
jgi:hypothetical protein